MQKYFSIIIGFIGLLFLIYWGITKKNLNPVYEVGQKIDSLNNIMVYYNGGVQNVVSRNSVKGYNLGLRYQCVEFVKRYYYRYYKHEMPDSYGHALSFFNKDIADGKLNEQRNLIQYSNASSTKPTVGDIVIFDKTTFNPYGHVAIISKVMEHSVEIIQQNPGPFSPSRVTIKIKKTPNDKWKIVNRKILGWLRKE